MFWEIANHIDSLGNHWKGYKYFVVKELCLEGSKQSKPIQYIDTEYKFIDASEDFEAWYKNNIKL